MTVDARLMTADELLRIPDDGYRYELVRGELKRMSPAKGEHGIITGRIHAWLGAWILTRKLGQVTSSDTGFLLSSNPDSVRCPDVAFIRADRVPQDLNAFVVPPDLAIEVISPTDRYSDVEEKKDEYLTAGVLAVVIVDPRRKTVTIHRPTGVEEVQETLVLEDVVPGWTLPLADIFA
ncbi:MAG TPA: Uma2 family endonuclease [Thermoanaerobaculia bacterium]|nr:Uma2 family endonuclease [Thermoanaerobaculia bacterium]